MRSDRVVLQWMDTCITRQGLSMHGELMNGRGTAAIRPAQLNPDRDRYGRGPTRKT